MSCHISLWGEGGGVVGHDSLPYWKDTHLIEHTVYYEPYSVLQMNIGWSDCHNVLVSASLKPLM